ncbi:hypothetical protein C1645_34910 [Glomus cerebriforme]|uniref:Uncharacterized protein n=1 Tax=Glomus cerebriforme TaxID=658196 RepID=A0A397TDM1_9GLOM|nr:hypothetical protein C1645_34910 [Glomus cerebriforme]
METFPNYDTSGLNSNSNEPEFNFEVLHDLNLADFLPISDSQQRQPTNSDRTTNFQQQSATNLSSQNSHGFSQPMTTAVSSSFSLSNNMLQTPKGSDVCSESMIISSFNMTTNSRDFQDDGLFFESLDSSALAEPSDVPFMTTVGLLSPQTSPTLSPDSSIIRRQGQKEKSSISQNCFRYSPITKQKLSSNNNNSMSQSRGRTSFINTANGNNNNSTNGQNNTTTNIMTSSPNKLAMTMELTSPLITPTSITPSLQDTIPNLNLGNNLVSSEVAMRPSTSILPSVVPITPSSLMEMKKKHSSLLKSEQNEQKSNLQQNKQNQLQPSSKVRTIFIAPSPQSQLNQIRTAENQFVQT